MSFTDSLPPSPARPDLSPWEDLLKERAGSSLLLIHILIGLQELRVFQGDLLAFSCAVSTSKHGPGEAKDSFCTPRGLHQVCEVIGTGEAPGRVFRSRNPLEEHWTSSQPVEDDLILSRILWLDGLEPGRNRNGPVDSKSRYIYIHGTNHEDLIGTPASIGCIRCSNQDVIELADQWIQPGCLCLIDS